MGFKDRVAVITGGTGALGRSVTLDLLNSGASVAVPYLEEKSWESLRSAVGEFSARLTGGPVDLRRLRTFVTLSSSTGFPALCRSIAA